MSRVQEAEDDDSDIELVRRWGAGDRYAGDKVVRRYFSVLRRFFVTQIADPDEREDLIQDTLQTLLQQASTYEGRASFKSFLFGIARYKLYAHLRQRYRANGKLDPITESIEDVLGRSPSSIAALHERSQRLLQALHELPLEDQLMIAFTYWEDMASPELAQVFEVTPDVVRARLSRARQKLLKKMSAPAALDAEAEHATLADWLRALAAEL